MTVYKQTGKKQLPAKKMLESKNIYTTEPALSKSFLFLRALSTDGIDFLRYNRQCVFSTGLINFPNFFQNLINILAHQGTRGQGTARDATPLITDGDS